MHLQSRKWAENMGPNGENRISDTLIQKIEGMCKRIEATSAKRWNMKELMGLWVTVSYLVTCECGCHKTDANLY